jgi:SAM-dependent methyltransferase
LLPHHNGGSVSRHQFDLILLQSLYRFPIHVRYSHNWTTTGQVVDVDCGDDASTTLQSVVARWLPNCEPAIRGTAETMHAADRPEAEIRQSATGVLAAAPAPMTLRLVSTLNPDAGHMPQRYRIQFPPIDANDLEQDEVSFQLMEKNRGLELRFHDYDQIYQRPGLYEQIFYDRLKCTSPKKVGELLKRTLDASDQNFTEMRVLDLGAGNGMMGEIMKAYGVARLVGADIIPEARDACFRDRPDIYDEYYVADFTNMQPRLVEEITGWSINCLTSVAALGFGDIPPTAFFQALQFVARGGWVAFNIKETFLDKSDVSGFSRFIRELIFSEYLDIHHIERYRHRLSMEGTPLFYFALVAQKTAEIPSDFLQVNEIGT